MDFEDITDYSELYCWLTGSVEYKEDVINLLCKTTDYSRQYCEVLLQENDFDFLKSYRKIIEDQVKKSLNN